MRKLIFLFIATLAVLAFPACNKAKIDKVDPGDISVNLNKAELQQRIIPLNYQVTFNSFKSGADVTPAPELWAIAQIIPDTRTYETYTWVASGLTTATTVNPDPINFPGDTYNTNSFTETLSITGAGTYYDATLGWNYAYFTSHVRDSVYGGEVFAVRYYNNAGVDDASALHAEASIFDNTADYNDLTIDAPEHKLWVVGDNNARGAL